MTLEHLDDDSGGSYFKSQLPELKRDQLDRVVIDHAPELPYEFSESFWEATNKRMDETIDRSDFQIVFADMQRGDLISNLAQDTEMTGAHQPASIFEDRFPDQEPDRRVIGERPGVEHAYIIASILDEADFSRVRGIADHYKHTLGTEFITLIAPYLATTRQDKNVDKEGSAYKPKTINIRAELGGLSPFIDRLIAFEPHSSATQYYAAQCGIPLAPLSPWKPVMEELMKEGIYVPQEDRETMINQDNTVIVGPDQGRNIAAVRISQHFGLPYVSFKKVRLSGYEVEVHELSIEDQNKVNGRIALSYDDEGSTFGTVRRLSDALQRYNASAFGVAVVHGKFTGDWRHNVRHPLLTKILVTDSRAPISRIDDGYNGPKIATMSLKDFTYEVIEADIQRVNFWSYPKFSPSILQVKEST